MARDGEGAPVDLCFTYKGWLRLNEDMNKQDKIKNFWNFRVFFFNVVSQKVLTYVLFLNNSIRSILIFNIFIGNNCKNLIMLVGKVSNLLS